MFTRTVQFTQGLFALTLLMALAMYPTVSVAEDQDPTGTWDIEIDMGGQIIPASITVTKNDDGTYAGSLSSEMGDAEFDSASFAGADLSFTQTFGEGDAALVFNFKGILDGDTFDGILSSDMGEMPVKGMRVTGGKIFGTWKLTSSSEGAEMEYTLVLNPDLTGTVNGLALNDLSLSNDSLNFKLALPIDGENVELTIEATHAKGELSGEAFVDGAAVAQLSGTFESDTTSSDGAGHYGTWTVESSSENGTQEHTFILNPDLTGTIDGIALTDLVLTATGLSYSMVIPIDGSPINLEIEMTIDGNTLDGEAYVDGATVADLKGTKANAEEQASEEATASVEEKP